MTFIDQAQGFILRDDYKNGREVCVKDQQAFGKFITVYLNPISKLGETEIFYYTKKEFNPNLPSLIFFTGGPGVNPRSTEFELEKTNVIFFDQRGTACSRPKTKEEFLNPEFYQSLFTAHDALKILDDLGIKKASVYGQSYGTVPATIFGSVFKERTQNVILEGVIFKGDETLWQSEIKRKNLMSVFNSFTPELQKSILDMNSYLPTNWFSKVGNMMLYLDNGVEIYRNFLTSLFEMDKDSQISFVNNFYPSDRLEEEFDFGDVMMGMIACHELSMNDPQNSMTLIFDNNNQLVYDQINEDKKDRCDKLTMGRLNTYHATDYLLSVPTLYLLGENDGATDLNQGLNHAKLVSRQYGQILMKKFGGHLPNLGFLKDDRYCDDANEDCSGLIEHRLQKKLFEGFIHQSKIDDFTLLGLNKVAEFPWIKL